MTIEIPGPIPGETVAEAEARITAVIFQMARDREGHWITRIWATYQLVQMAYAKRRREKAQWDFLGKLLGWKL